MWRLSQALPNAASACWTYGSFSRVAALRSCTKNSLPRSVETMQPFMVTPRASMSATYCFNAAETVEARLSFKKYTNVNEL